MEGRRGQLRFAQPACVGLDGGWPRVGAVWRRPPGAVHGDSCSHAAGSTPEPQPGALGALWQQRCPPASACSGPRPRLYACPPARSPRGRSWSRRQVALGVWPSLPESRRARPSGHPARPSPRAAPLAVPISGSSLFSHLPVARPGRLIQCLVINLAFQNGQRAG